MYYLSLLVKPQETHPEFQTIGEAMVNCWLDYATEKEALQATRNAMSEAEWDIIEIDQVDEVARDEFDETDVEFYDQAVLDKEVYVFDQLPRYPVFYIQYRVVDLQANEPCFAEVWIVNEAVDSESDPFDVDFWSDELVETTLSIAAQTLQDENYQVLEVVDKFPCGRDQFDDPEQVAAYDKAEEHGLCICISEGIS